MPFVQSVQRGTGVTLDELHVALGKHVQSLNVVDPSQVWIVLDDEVKPAEHPSQSAFITVRLPSFVWEYGDVFIGGGDVGEFILQGQTRITLWLRNSLDYFGKVNAVIAQAAAGAPKGNKMLGALIRGLHETDIMRSDGVTSVLKRPLRFVSYEPPLPGAEEWRPFRIIMELEFTWDLSQETLVVS